MLNVKYYDIVHIIYITVIIICHNGIVFKKNKKEGNSSKIPRACVYVYGNFNAGVRINWKKKKKFTTRRIHTHTHTYICTSGEKVEEVHRMNFSKRKERGEKGWRVSKNWQKKRSSNEKIKSVDNLSDEQVLLLDEIFNN